MKIDKTVELSDGSITFNGELTGQELDIVIQYGLNTLMMLGAIKTNVMDTQEEDESGEKPGDSTLQ